MFRIEREKLILALCGMNLMLLQFLMLREFTMILTGLEFVVVLLSASYFLGFSVGYALSDRLSQRLVEAGVALLFLIHLTLPFSPRLLAGFLAAHDIKHYSLLALMFVTAFGLSSVYSIFLPRIIGKECSSEKLSRSYSIDLAGSLLGLLVLAAALRSGSLLPLMLIYFAVMVTVVILVNAQRKWAGAMALCLAFYAFSFPAWDQKSLEYFFKHAKGFSKVHSLYQAHSPYQKVDVLENQQGERFLYLEGLLHFNSRHLEAFNFFLSELPAQLQKKSKVLIVGSGSMSSVHHVAPYATSIQVVELDRAVAAAGRWFFAKFNHLDEVHHWTLAIDDAKHFLGSHPEERYDLVIMDVPAPVTIQEAMLHSKEFYSLVNNRLSEHGVISISLSGKFEPGSLTPTSVAAGVLSVFPESFVVTSSSAQRSFALAGRHLDFTRRDIEDILKERSNEAFALFERPAMEAIAAEVAPIRMDRMDLILKNNLRRGAWLYFPEAMKGL